MKYFMISLAIFFSASWYWLQSKNTDHKQDTKIQIQGEVQGLEGNIIINIQDNYLNLSNYDRFILQVHSASKGKLSIQVMTQPKKQHCKIEKSNTTTNRIFLNISCKVIVLATLNNVLVSL